MNRRAQLDKRPRDVASMFDEVASRYDLMNDVMTAGIHRTWRAAAVDAVAARPGDVVLDIGAGTGFSSEPYRAAGVRVVPADFSLGMLRVGKERVADLPFTAADATRLPFADDSFDAVTMSYALRNVGDHAAALREFHRVTRPGGTLVVLEFSSLTVPAVNRFYKEYLMTAIPAAARRLSSNPDAYVYLAESIQAWPDQRALAQDVAAAGWTGVEWRNLTGGIVALHRAVKPAGKGGSATGGAQKRSKGAAA